LHKGSVGVRRSPALSAVTGRSAMQTVTSSYRTTTASDARRTTLRSSNFLDITRGSCIEVDEQGIESEKAGIFSSFVNLANTVMGTGVLALPMAVRQAGMVPGMSFLLLGAVLAGISLYMLGASALKTGDKQSFTTLGDLIRPGFSIVAEICVILNSLGAAIGYLIVASTSFQISFGGSRQLWVLVGTAFAAPLALLRKMDALRFTSALAVAVLVLLGVMVILFYSDAFALVDPCGDVSDCHGTVEAVGSPFLAILSSFVVFTNAFTCQQSLLPILAELADPSPRRLVLLITMSLALAMPLYAVFSVFGYLTYGDNVKSNLLDNYPNNGLTVAARIGIAIVVITSFPLQAFATRKSFVNIYRTARALWCAPKDGDSMPAGQEEAAQPKKAVPKEARPSVPETSWANEIPTPAPGAGWCERFRALIVDDMLELAVVVCIVGLSFGVAMVVDDLGIIVSITGATGAASITFIFPGLFYMKFMAAEGWTCLRGASLALLLFGVIIIPTSLVLTSLGY